MTNYGWPDYCTNTHTLTPDKKQVKGVPREEESDEEEDDESDVRRRGGEGRGEGMA